MFKTWKEGRRINKNPAAGVVPFPQELKRRRIFSIPEAQHFFVVAFPDLRYKTINMLAAATGMRLVEYLGLMRTDIKKESARGVSITVGRGVDPTIAQLSHTTGRNERA